MEVKGEPIMKYTQNITASFTSDCKMLNTLCIDVKSYVTATTKYKFIKGGVTLTEGTMDSCDKIKNADKNFKKVLAAYKWPLACPVKAVC